MQKISVPYIPFPLPDLEDFGDAKDAGLLMRLPNIYPISAPLSEITLSSAMVEKLMQEGVRLMQTSPQYWCFVRELPDEAELPKLLEGLRDVGADTDFLMGVALVTATAYATLH